MAEELGERLERLRSVPLFAGLDEASLRHVAEALGEFDARPGQMLVEASASGSGMFFVSEGEVEVEARRQKVALGPGEFFGELALLNADERRTARVRAKTDVRGYALGRADFERLVEAEPRLALGLLRGLAQRFSETMR